MNFENSKECDFGVALFFFNRPEPLKKVFEAIKRNKPKILFLIQDGPRDNNLNDMAKVIACREIVETIDWDCEVHKNYSDINLTCDNRVFTGISWAFEYVEKLIVFEDDCVPSQSFIPFCEEVLERYKYDERVHMISGMNYLDEFKGTDDSYFFSQTASGWGWATWKRVWTIVEEQKNYDFLLDEKLKVSVTNYIKSIGLKVNGIKNFISNVEKFREQNLANDKVNSWENALGIGMFLSASLVITPQKNLVSNIGLTDDSTHAVNSIKKISKKTQQLFFKKVYNIEFPLKHPKYVVRNVEYEKMHRKIVGANDFIIFSRRVEGILRRIVFSNNEERKELIKKLIKK